MSPQQKATPGENSGGRTLLSVTQVSGLPARPPSLPERRKDNPEIPPGFLVGLGQSHLSHKIPAATTRCVYLDHLLSRAVNFAEVYYHNSDTARRIFRICYALLSGAEEGRRPGWRSVPGWPPASAPRPRGPASPRGSPPRPRAPRRRARRASPPSRRRDRLSR